MARPEPTYEFYRDEHRGKLEQGAFDDALPLASARAREIVAVDVPEALAEAYMHAVCALCDRVSGADARGTVKSETVGGTSLTYADAEGASAFSDADAVRPWLAGTGLLWRGIG